MSPNGVEPKTLAFYGKGGIGKTVVATNLAAALAEIGEKAMLYGCSPKSNVADVYINLEPPTPVLDIYRSEGLNAQNVYKTYVTTPRGVIITEMGGPEPGIGCAGKGVGLALESITKLKEFVVGYDQVSYNMYDVIGDVVCGGFATPMRQSKETYVFIVSSGELMSLYAANNIIKAVVAQSDLGVKVAGIIGNFRGIEREEEIMASFSQRTKVPVLAKVPRKPDVFKTAEVAGGTIVEVYPDSEIANSFRELAARIKAGLPDVQAEPIDDYNELFDMYLEFQRGDSLLGTDASADRAAAYKQKMSSVEVVKRDKPMRISIYGTGGIGKSTTSSNLSAALVQKGEVVYQIGCDPKHDSIATLCGELKPTYLDELRRTGIKRPNREFVRGLVFEGIDFNGRLWGSECGGPAPGRGCAGKGVGLALRYIEQFKPYQDFGATFVLYDVLGDTVCGGFATPLEFSPQAYVVTSGEIAPMVQAMKIIQSVFSNIKQNPNMDLGVAGVIDNMRGVPHEREIVEEVFGSIGVPVLHHIPRSGFVQEAENVKRTVVQVFPDSDQTKEYVQLAEKVLANTTKIRELKRDVLSSKEIKAILAKYS